MTITSTAAAAAAETPQSQNKAIAERQSKQITNQLHMKYHLLSLVLGKQASKPANIQQQQRQRGE